MDARDHSEHAADTNGICRLEWIALAIDAARRHKEDEQRILPTVPRLTLVPACIDPEHG
jgi:hypothetical protein